MSGDGSRGGSLSEGSVLLPFVTAAVALLANPAAVLPGRVYYFRDMSLAYVPLRSFFEHAMKAGRFPFWDPYLHEGCAFIPVFYPLELLQALVGGAAVASWLLTLHFSLAAVSAYALARELGASRWGAFASGVVYSLGGFCQSSLNLPGFLEALALAPAVALLLRRAALGGRRAVVQAALVLALSVTSLAVELVGQGVLLGLALGVSARPRRASVGKVLGAIALGLGLAAVPIALMMGLLLGSLRGSGGVSGVAMQNPFSAIGALQLLVPDAFGSTQEPLRFWWGGRLQGGASPYFMSLYIGPVALALAAVGFPRVPQRARAALALCAGGALLLSLGRSGGVAVLLFRALPFFRFPVKALLLPYLAVATSAGFGFDHVARSGAKRGLVAAALTLSAAAPVAVGLFLHQPNLGELLDIPPLTAAIMRQTLTWEAVQASATALCLVLVGLSARRHLSASTSVTTLAALLVVDLLRGAVGLNPQAGASFYDPLAALAPYLDQLRGSRLFTYGVESSPAFQRVLAERGPGIDASGFLLSRRMLTPFSNLLDRVETAEGLDRTAFIPNPPALSPAEYDPAQASSILDRLRNAAVARVLSLDTLDDPELKLRATIPAGVSDLSIHVYDLGNPWPRAYVACRVLEAQDVAVASRAPFERDFDPGRDVALEVKGEAACHGGTLVRRTKDESAELYEVRSDGTGYVVMRDSYARGIYATLDGVRVPVLRANGRHRAVKVPGGQHRLTVSYEPTGLREGLLVTLASSVAAGALYFGRRLG